LDYTETEDMSYGGGLTGGFLVIIIVLIIYIFMMVWVYKDAKQRNMEPVLYLVLIFFFNCCGLIIYFLARAENPIGGQGGIYGSTGPQIDTAQYGQPQHRQPQYGQPQYGQPQYGQPQYGQPQYGQTQTPPSPQPQKKSHQTKFCRYCGAEMPNDAKFCSICGANEFND